MRDKIQKIVVEAVAGTKDITEAIDELLLLHNVSNRALGTESGGIGTMDANCDHEIEPLFTKNKSYKADYCIKCGGVY